MAINSNHRVLQVRDGRDVLAACGARGAGELGKLAAGAVDVALEHLHLAELEPGGEMAVVLLGDSFAKRAQYSVGRAAGVGVLAEVARDPGMGAVEVGDRLGIAPRLAAVAAKRGLQLIARLVIAAVEEQGLGQRQSRVGILVGRAAALEAAAQGVAIVLDAHPGDGDRRLLGGLLLGERGRRHGQQGEQQDGTHRHSPHQRSA